MVIIPPMIPLSVIHSKISLRQEFIQTESKASFSQTFMAKKLRKEINLLARKSSKRKVLELYANAVKQEQKKLETKNVINPLSRKLRKHLGTVMRTAMSPLTWSQGYQK